jgi:tetratricopeptide (TPR) repeat protein
MAQEVDGIFPSRVGIVFVTKLTSLHTFKSKTCGTMIALCLFVAIVSYGAFAQTPTATRAMVLEQQGRWEEAAQAWRGIIRQNPKDAIALANLGLALARQQKYLEAVSAYKSALALQPKMPNLQLNLGLAEFKQGHFEPAIKSLTAELVADPQNLQARTLLGVSYYGERRFADAADNLQIAAKVGLDSPELLQMLAQSCMWARRYQCSLQAIHQLLEKSPNSASAHILTGQALDGLGQDTEALAEFQTAARISPKEPNVHFAIGYLYWKSYQYDKARPEFETEIANDPNNPQALAYLGDLEMKAAHTDKAILWLKKATEQKNPTRLAFIDLASIYSSQKRYPEAIKVLKNAIELDPKQSDVHYQLARLYQTMGNSGAAAKEFALVRTLRKPDDEDIAHKMAPIAPTHP